MNIKNSVVRAVKLTHGKPYSTRAEIRIECNLAYKSFDWYALESTHDWVRVDSSEFWQKKDFLKQKYFAQAEGLSQLELVESRSEESTKRIIFGIKVRGQTRGMIELTWGHRRVDSSSNG